MKRNIAASKGKGMGRFLLTPPIEAARRVEAAFGREIADTAVLATMGSLEAAAREAGYIEEASRSQARPFEGVHHA